jgi:hypothetical protein
VSAGGTDIGVKALSHDAIATPATAGSSGLPGRQASRFLHNRGDMQTPPAPSLARTAALAARVIPQRTAAGQAALTRRTRELTPRQRTALFIVDGRRSVDIVLALAARAGARAADFSALVILGLVETPGLDDPSVLTDSSVLPSSQLPLLPSSQSLQGDSTWSQLDGDASAPFTDAPLIEARALLLRAVRSQAPLAGALTVMRLKRAETRADLEALLDEVEQRLRKPHRRIIAAQTLRHVRHLLSLPPNTRPPVMATQR